MRLSIIGSGYVGLVTGAVFAEKGNQVVCIDNDKKKIELLKNEKIPIYEPGLEELVLAHKSEGRLRFTTDIASGIKDSEVVFICVGTPPKKDGSPDLTSIEHVAKEISKSMKGYKVIVEKSTVPVMTADWMKELMQKYLEKADFDIAVNPEFLREGSALKDAMNPDRIVIGTDSQKADAILTELYKPFNAPIIHTDMRSAELIKHASNAFLAMKISYANLVSRLCEAAGADIEVVMKGIGADKRIGYDFLKAGIGYGGFCFPKDLDAFIHTFERHGITPSLLKAVSEINVSQRKYFVEKIEKELGGVKGKRLGVLGLAFKPNTDDMRFAPSIDIISKLQELGAGIAAYDPKAMENAKKILKNITYCTNPYAAAENADALLILTEWDEFKHLRIERIKKQLKQPIIFDGRNIYDPQRMHQLGIKYFSIGRAVSVK
ncbi:MAG: UDP-glucose/GDP-mannose dehydrogenase family protein [Candidatus Woesearchaeota archaeon]